MGRAPLVRLPVERVDQPGQESPFAFPCGAVTSLPASQPGIEQIPHGIAEHVEAVHHNRQENPWPERQPGGHLHVLTSFPAEQTSPASNLGGQSESQEAQRGFGHDDPANVDREDNDDRCHNIGQHMSQEDLARGGAHGPGGQKIVILFDTDHGASDDSGADDAS